MVFVADYLQVQGVGCSGLRGIEATGGVGDSQNLVAAGEGAEAVEFGVVGDCYVAIV